MRELTHQTGGVAVVTSQNEITFDRRRKVSRPAVMGEKAFEDEVEALRVLGGQRWRHTRRKQRGRRDGHKAPGQRRLGSELGSDAHPMASTAAASAERVWAKSSAVWVVLTNHASNWEGGG